MYHTRRIGVIPCLDEFISENIKIHLDFLSILHTDMAQVIKLIPRGRHRTIYLHGQCHWHRWQGDSWTQGISSCSDYRVTLEYFSFRTISVDQPIDDILMVTLANTWHQYFIVDMFTRSTSHKICTRFCCALFCLGLSWLPFISGFITMTSWWTR